MSRQLYLPETAVLVTRFMTEAGVGEVVDFMPVAGEAGATEHHRLVRVVRVVRGEMPFVFECAPRFDYGRVDHSVELTDDGVVFSAEGHQLTLHTARLLTVEPVSQQARGQGGGVTAAATLRAGDVGAVMLEYGPTGGPRRLERDEALRLFRDASFSVFALLRLGYVDEARAFVRWLADRVHEQVGTDSGPLKIMYRVDGSSDLVEESLDHFEGYRGSRPVRIGNGAADQLQLDIYGEAMESIWYADRHGVAISHDGWTRLAAIQDWLCDHWDEPDEGIWETRGGRKDFVYCRLNAWVALDRAIRLSAERGLPGDVARWTAERDRVYRQIMERGWHPGRGAFVQHYDTDVLDAALLRMSHVGFISPSDPMWLSTLEAFDKELVSDSLVYRYNPEASPDGLLGEEGTFSLCTFLYVEALARSGRLDQARLTFEKMLTYANHLGLYGEEIGLTGDQLGNFPQAFTHLALVNSAGVLDTSSSGHPPTDPVVPGAAQSSPSAATAARTVG